MEGFQITGGQAGMSAVGIEATVGEAGPGAMEVIDHGLDRLEEALKHLEARLGPALTQYGELDAIKSAPRPEPSSAIRSKADRLHDLVTRLEHITSRVEL